MKNESYNDTDLELVQKTLLKLFKEFDKLCLDNNLEYWMCYGTLIGALRHGGFIPWDDDIDLVMQRNDYDKLISILSKTNIYYSDRDILKIFYKDTPVVIDIFPVDSYYKKDIPIYCNKLSRKFKKARLLITYTPNNNNIWNHTLYIPDKSKEELKSLTKSILMEDNYPIKDGTLFTGLETNYHRVNNKFIEYNQIFPLQRLKFEDYNFYAPAYPELVLRGYYNDIWAFPSNQVPKHNFLDSITTNIKEKLKNYIKNDEYYLTTKE